MWTGIDKHLDATNVHQSCLICLQPKTYAIQILSHKNDTKVDNPNTIVC